MSLIPRRHFRPVPRLDPTHASDVNKGPFRWGYRFDPSVAKVGKGGLPPEGHVRRCQARARYGSQCPQWARIGFFTCHFHKFRRVDRGEAKIPINMSLYGRRVNKKLNALLEELSNGGDKERLSLADEIDATRVLCERAFALFGAATMDEEGKERTDVDPALKTRLIAQAHESFAHLSQLIVRHQAVVANSTTMLDGAAMDKARSAITKILMEELHGHPDILDRISSRLETLKVETRQGPTIVIA